MAVRIIARRGVGQQGDPEPLDRSPVIVVAERHAGWGGGWVARILAVDPNTKGGLVRDFIPAYERRLSRAGNGMVEFRLTEAGLYEVEYVRRSFEVARLYVLVLPDGTVKEVGYHQPGHRRSAVLDASIVAALAELATATAS